MKKIISAVMATTFVLGLALASHAASGIQCKILTSKENTVIMDCDKLANELKVGDQVILKTKTTKQKRELEQGC